MFYWWFWLFHTAWYKKICSIQINILRREFQIYWASWRTPTRDTTVEAEPISGINYNELLYRYHFSRDEKELFINGEPTNNWLKNDFNSEYTIDIMDSKFVMEKGFFHIFGEYFTSEISFIRNDAPDITACALSLGKEAGKSTCPEQENFRNR